MLACGRTPELPADIQAAAIRVPDAVDYNLHIKPILSDRCFACHGPDQNKQKAGLRLDIAENAYANLKSGRRAIVPGSLAKSELFHRIISTDPDVMMPTPDSHLSLTAEEQATLLRWIEQGAEYKKHWSLIAPTMPEVPNVDGQGWIRNDIDRFVWAKLREKGLSPNPEADKATLLRRVSLDLTGLPPTPAEVDAFLADTSPNAYQKVVNRLLNSPHYGEQLATNWLDIARYADTHGYQLDVMRTAWPYRDWVIRAFNRNLSFDRFITWQLAGDLLPAPVATSDRRDQLIATAFNRMHPQNQEGGIVEEEYLTEYAADRTATFGKAMLGLTVECARCHDHKYDPISQKDYYQLFAFFNGINEAGQVPFYGESSPTLILTDRKADEQLRYIQTKIRRVEDSLRSPHPSPYGRSAVAGGAGAVRRSGEGNSGEGPIARYTFDDTSRYRFANAVNVARPATVTGNTDLPPTVGPGRFGRGRLVNGEGNIDLGPDLGFFERYDPFSVGLWIKLLKRDAKGPIFSRSSGLDNGDRGYELKRHKDGTLSFNLSHNYPDNAIDLHTLKPAPLGQWLHITVTYDGSGSATGTRLYLNGQLAPTRIHADNLKRSIVYGPGYKNGFNLKLDFQIGSKFRDSMADFWVDELNLFHRAIAPGEVLALSRNQFRPQPVPVSRGVTDSALVRRQQLLRDLRKAETDIYDAQLEVMIMRERRVTRPTHLLKRGAYDAPGEIVQPNTLTSLGSLPNELPKNRLGLAQWLLRADNPLFARVAVNRFWQQLFGQGLVKSSDDFGNQGSLPSHPELLDYLAVRFRTGGWPTPTDEHGPLALANRWNVKALMREVVLSATYRQASWSTNALVNAKKRETDPDNTWLARGPSYRLSAEQVRDGALAAAGLLNRCIGGPSAYPYQPGGIWETLNHNTPYRQSHGDDLYRRSMYTIWKRTAPPPMMLNFDASERHLCTVRRQKTSTPLQALVTLNDPQFIEAARVLAQQVIKSGSRQNRDELIRQFVKTILNRPARSVEVELLKKLYADEVLSFKNEPKRANALLAVGEYPRVTSLTPTELAAWTVVVSTIMNMDEALVKR
ncbi:DUF1553 domain-containing protein [Spirosoma arcticum]